MKDITENLDNKRKPLNESERGKISKKQLYPYIGANNIMGYVDEYLFDEEIICIAEDGGSWGENQKCCVFVNEKCWVNNHAHVLKSNGKADLKYLMYYLNATNLNSFITGSTRGKLTKSSLDSIQIPLPPLATQKRIAEILDAADALRRKDQELLKKYDELAQAIFIDMFGDPVKNEKGWEKVKMEKLMTIVRGGSPRPIDKFLGGNYPWIKIGDATRGDDVYLNSTREHIIEEGLSKTRLLPAGSLIFANCGVSLGFARIITFKGCIHDGWLAFSDFDDLKINKIFLLKALNSITQYFRDSAPEGTQPNLNTGIIKDFELILPPLKLQNKFELILNSFQGIKENAECNFKNSNQLFDSLIQKAFKGELVA